MKRKEFEEIFRTSFDDSEQWRRWLVDKVITGDDQIYLSDTSSGRAAAALLMQPYDMLYQCRTIPTGYISCVATRPEARSKGAATALMKETLRSAYDKGYALAELIPASDHLYFFYDRLGFATVFYHDRERYTAMHTFAGGSGEVVEPSYDLFAPLEQRLGAVVLHTGTDYDRIVEDMAMEPRSAIIAAIDGEDSAMLFGVDGPRQITVRCLLADTDTVAYTALAELRRRMGEKPVVVNRPPVSGLKTYLRPYGMGRVVNARTVLEAMAANHPDMKLAVRLRDSIIHPNNGLFIIGGGCVDRPVNYRGHVDLDVDIATFTSILFSNHKVGGIFSLPTHRPFMSLMLD